jgi:uncharacterized protein
MLLAHDTVTTAPAFTGWIQVAAGVLAGFGIGVVASLLGVAGGEFLIPTLVLPSAMVTPFLLQRFNH